MQGAVKIREQFFMRFNDVIADIQLENVMKPAFKETGKNIALKMKAHQPMIVMK